MVSVSVVRTLWGAALAVCPATVLRLCPHTPVSSAGTTVVRLLGIRQLAQGIVGTQGPWPARWAALPDALHAATMAGVALGSRRWRTAALVDLVVAGAFATQALRTKDADSDACRDRAAGGEPPPPSVRPWPVGSRRRAAGAWW